MSTFIPNFPTYDCLLSIFEYTHMNNVFEIVFKYDACLLPELLRNFYDNADDDDVTAADGDGDSDDEGDDDDDS